MFSFVQNLVVHAGALGALGFFIGALLEEVAFPLPSPLLLVGVAFFFGKPITFVTILKILGMVVLPITAGATVGSLVIFGLAYFGGYSAIHKFNKYLGFSWEDVDKFRQKLSRVHSDEWILFLSRCLPFTPTSLITIAAGLLRMNPLIFIALTFSGIFIRVAGLFVGALFFGGSLLPH
jgi:membrane protein DedA with SNARE-associated domain